MLSGTCLAMAGAWGEAESARGLAQSMTLRAAQARPVWRQLLDCASPLALLHDARRADR